MAATNTGRFVFHELHTTDRAKAIKFWSQMMAWEIREVSMGPGEPYGVVFKDGQRIAGICKSKAPVFVPSHWLPYAEVENVDAAAKKAAELSARVLQKPMEIPDIGKFAPVADPIGAGAVFCTIEPATPLPEEPAQPPVDTFMWDELLTPDAPAAATFYAGFFGLAPVETEVPMMGKYILLRAGNRARAGITNLPPGMPRPAWLPYLHVANVDAAVEKAIGLGAKVMVAPRDGGNFGRVAIVVDPTGAPIGFCTPGAP